ncbi:universal stress protein [Acetobacterium bakii]|uniref:UspA domain-containing protein n=1 Tax=Acetobacterium bakii TaxID=52689 RepID=A0A0L6TZX9_9FIRM|nr:universal stress protein [Acetobacterium bakii]KNZ41642.1 hypothetical protein AKG39_10625 [Acetobacterium bakii]
MFDKILIVSEISTASAEMIKCVEDLRKLGTKECLLAQIFNPGDIEAGVSDYLRSIFEENLKKQKETLENEDYKVESMIISGNFKNEINRLATEEGCSLIVVGGEKHTLVGALLFGGIAYDVLYGAKLPVLLIRPSKKSKLELEKCQITDHVLFPTDFSDNADVAFDYVKDMVKAGVSKVTMLHVQDQFMINPYLLHRLVEFNEVDKERLQNYKDELLAMGKIEVDMRISFGSPTSEILSFIDAEKIPLVVMGTQGRGYIKEVFLGSVSHNISRHASASVLLIPGHRK